MDDITGCGYFSGNIKLFLLRIIMARCKCFTVLSVSFCIVTFTCGWSESNWVG